MGVVINLVFYLEDHEQLRGLGHSGVFVLENTTENTMGMQEASLQPQDIVSCHVFKAHTGL